MKPLVQAFYDPATREIAVMRGDSAEVTFLDAASGKIVARLKMPTRKLEASAAAPCCSAGGAAWPAAPTPVAPSPGDALVQIGQRQCSAPQRSSY